MARLQELREFHMPGSECVSWSPLIVDCGHLETKCQFSWNYAQLLPVSVRQMLKKAFEQPRTTSFCNHPAAESYITDTLGFVHAKKAHGGGEARLHSFPFRFGGR
jgi:hypothetical protein